MLKFTDYLYEGQGLPHRDTKTADEMASRGISKSTSITPSPTPLKKPKFQSFEDCEKFVKKVIAGRKRTSNNDIDNPTPEYNGVYITSKTNIMIEAENGYKYSLFFVPSEKSTLPLYHLESVPQIDAIKPKFYTVPDKYLPNIKRIFTILKEWKNVLTHSPIPESKISSFDSFLNEWVTNEKVPTTSTNTATANNSSKTTLSIKNFLNMKLSALKTDKRFKNFKDYGEVLASIEMLLGNKEKNIPAIINDMTISNLLRSSRLFKSASEANSLKPLWYLKIKTVVGNEEPDFREVKFKTLIKKGSEIQICKFKTVDTEQPIYLTIKVEEIEGKNKDENDY